MRVIAGKYRSRPLRSLKGMDIRPTSDRLRETLFDVLTAGNPAALDGTIWIDLYAGTGAVGIEALSRGAEMVYFVEASRQAAELIAENLAGLKIEGHSKVLKLDVLHALPALASDHVAANFIFLDPPYRMQEVYAQTLNSLAQTELLKLDGVVIAEHEKRFDPGETCGQFRRARRLVQGDAALSFYQRERQ